MKKYLLALAAFSMLPTTASALANDSVQNIGINFVAFATVTLIPFLFALALLFFVFNVVRYFIIQRGLQGRYNYGSEGAARSYALYGLAGMVLMVIVWGVVNLVVGGLGFDRSVPVCPDYLPPSVCAEFQGEPTTRMAPSRVAPASPQENSPTVGSPDAEAVRPTGPSNVPSSPAQQPSAPSGVNPEAEAIAQAETRIEADLRANDPSANNEQIAAQMELILDERSDDNVKVASVRFLVESGRVDESTAKLYVDALNQQRRLQGLTVIDY